MKQGGAGGRLSVGGLFREGAAGLTTALPLIANGFSYAALVFSGSWEPFIGKGVAIMMVTSAAIGCAATLFGDVALVVAGPTAATSAVLAVALGQLAPMVAGQQAGVALATAYAAIAAATVLTGLVMLLIGALRLGRTVRFVPYPVLAGFMAASGWLMVAGAVRMATGLPLSPQSIPRLMQPHEALLLLAVLGFAAIVGIASSRWRHPLMVPGLLVLATAGTDAALKAMGWTLEAARSAGVLFSLVGGASFDVPLLSGLFFHADWPAVFGVVPAILSLVALAVLQAMFAATALEAPLDIDVDLDRQMRAQGIGTIASGALGGSVGVTAVLYTLLCVKAGGRGRAASFTVVLAALAAIAVGGDVIAVIPRFAFGGLLLVLGAGLFREWIVLSRHRMPLWEWLLAVAAIPVTAVFGFMPAVILGTIGGCLLLAVSMIRIGVIRRRYDVSEGPSSLLRPEDEMQVLAQHGAEAQVIELRGFIFFGSAYQVYTEVKRIVSQLRVRVLVLDFTAVVGIDSAALATWGRIRSLTGKSGQQLMVAGVKPAVASRLQAGALGAGLGRHATIDEAIEAAEMMILAAHKPSGCDDPDGNFDRWLADALGDVDLAQELSAQLTFALHPPGTVLCRQGDATDSLLFIESGRVRVMIRSPDGVLTRVRVFGRHSVVGELAFLLGTPRTATLEVEQTARVGTLHRPVYQAFARERPEIAVALLSYLVRIQAERLSFSNRMSIAFRY